MLEARPIPSTAMRYGAPLLATVLPPVWQALEQACRDLERAFVVDRHVHAAVLLRLVGDELPQPGIALRPEAQIVDRQLRPLAPQHRCGGLDQPLDRDLLGVVVAANEIVFREWRPFWRRVRQAAAIEAAVVENAVVHGGRFSR